MIAPNDVWAAGDQGAAVHWDGTQWTTIPTGNSGDYHGVWASASNDVWVAGAATPGNFPPGAIAHWDGQMFNSIFSSASTLSGIAGHYAISATPNRDAGAYEIIGWNGQTWTEAEICNDLYGTGDPMLGIAATETPDFVWLVDGAGQVYSGPVGVTPAGCSEDFEPNSSPRPDGARFTGPICAIGDSASGGVGHAQGGEVWVAGEAGALYRWQDDSPSWLPVTTGTTEAIHGLWGVKAGGANGPNTVIAVGDHGTILVFHAGVLVGSAHTDDRSLYAVGGQATLVGPNAFVVTAWAVGEGGAAYKITVP
jgi:hypothetical protein